MAEFKKIERPLGTFHRKCLWPNCHCKKLCEFAALEMFLKQQVIDWDVKA